MWHDGLFHVCYCTKFQIYVPNAAMVGSLRVIVNACFTVTLSSRVAVWVVWRDAVWWVDSRTRGSRLASFAWRLKLRALPRRVASALVLYLGLEKTMAIPVDTVGERTDTRCERQASRERVCTSSASTAREGDEYSCTCWRQDWDTRAILPP